MDADDDTKLYLIVAKELSIGRRNEGLWTKAFALENGDEKATKARYIRERVEQLKHQNSVAIHQKSPAPVIATGATAIQPEQDSSEVDESTGAPSPWSRFFARGIDLAVVVVLATCAQIMLVFSLRTNGIGAMASIWVASLIFGVVLLIYEALSLSLFSTTFGKFVFGLRVRTTEGQSLNASSAFKRAFWVWASGNACYIVFAATLFTWWRGYKQLKANGYTSWDDRVGSSVSQADIGPLRFSIGALTGLFLLVSVFVLNGISNQANKIERKAERQENSNSAQNMALDDQITKSAPEEQKSSKETPVDWSSFTPIVEIPQQSGVALTVQGLRNDGVLLGTVTNTSEYWQVSEVKVTLVDADQHVAVLNGSRPTSAHSETYRYTVDLPPGSVKPIEIPVQWNYQREFLVASDFRGSAIRNKK